MGLSRLLFCWSVSGFCQPVIRPSHSRGWLGVVDSYFELSDVRRAERMTKAITSDKHDIYVIIPVTMLRGSLSERSSENLVSTHASCGMVCRFTSLQKISRTKSSIDVKQ